MLVGTTTTCSFGASRATADTAFYRRPHASPAHDMYACNGCLVIISSCQCARVYMRAQLRSPCMHGRQFGTTGVMQVPACTDTSTIAIKVCMQIYIHGSSQAVGSVRQRCFARCATAHKTMQCSMEHLKERVHSIPRLTTFKGHSPSWALEQGPTAEVHRPGPGWVLGAPRVGAMQNGVREAERVKAQQHVRRAQRAERILCSEGAHMR